MVAAWCAFEPRSPVISAPGYAGRYEEGTVHEQLALVVNEARFTKRVLGKTDARLRGADQVGWRVLINLWSDQLRHAVFSPSAGDRPYAPLNRPGSDSIGPVACDRVFSASSFPT